MAKNYRQIEGLRRQMTECLENAYNRGYKQGQADETKSQDAISEKAYCDGYNKGMADGNINDGTFAKKVNEAYNNGAKDAWQCYSENLFNFEKEANRQFQENMRKRMDKDYFNRERESLDERSKDIDQELIKLQQELDLIKGKYEKLESKVNHLYGNMFPPI